MINSIELKAGVDSTGRRREQQAPLRIPAGLELRGAMTRRDRNFRWRNLVVVALVGVAAVADLTQAAAQTRPQTKEELAAIRLIEQWAAAFGARDPEKIGSYMAENGEFDDDPREPPKKGRTALIDKIGKYVAGGGLSMKVTETFAISGEEGTAVLVKRMDTFVVNGRKMTAPIAGFFWVKDGKIQMWVDRTLIPETAPPPPNAGVPR
jgi:limonene-1,2-epoxide hydrolase